MRVLILANGDPPSATLALQLAVAHDLLVATDGAAHRAAGLGLTPDVICGDFDSVRLDQARAQFPQAEFLPLPDQEHADLEKAIQSMHARGAAEITVLGATGGRVDHTLANYALLLRYHTVVPLRMVDDLAEVWALSGGDDVPGERTFAAMPGDTLSLLSFDGAARVSLSGVRWPLENAVLPIGTRGVSNVAESDRISLQVVGGALLVCHFHQPLPPHDGDAS